MLRKAEMFCHDFSWYSFNLDLNSTINTGIMMTKYRFDWKDVIHGTIEIDAQCGNDAEEILMNMTLKDLLKNSQYNSDKSEREIRFVDAGEHFESLDKDDWEELKHNL